jgi:hypothetical protein
MDRCCSPNSIQVSDPVLSLLGLEHAQFAPSCKLLCGGHEVLLHRWLGQVRGRGCLLMCCTAVWCNMNCWAGHCRCCVALRWAALTCRLMCY